MLVNGDPAPDGPPCPPLLPIRKAATCAPGELSRSCFDSTRAGPCGLQASKRNAPPARHRYNPLDFAPHLRVKGTKSWAATSRRSRAAQTRFNFARLSPSRSPEGKAKRTRHGQQFFHSAMEAHMLLRREVTQATDVELLTLIL